MTDRKPQKLGKNPMDKPRITDTTKNNNSLGKFVKAIEEAPLKRDEFSQIRQYLQDALIKNHSKIK